MPVTIITNQRYNKTFIIDVNTQYTQVPNAPLQLTDINAVNNMIINVLFTSPGEVPFEPQFGAGFLNALFDNTTSQSAATLIHNAYFSLKDWIPWITVDRNNSYISVNQATSNITCAIIYSINNIPGQYIASLSLSTQQ